MTTKRNGDSVPSGWCLTGHHEMCDEFFMPKPYAQERGCSCKHHETKVDKKTKKK